MRAKLEGKEFDIAPVGADVQELPSTGYREWRWDVTPTTSGTHSLFLTVSVLYVMYPNPIEEKVFERKIDVAINPGYSLGIWLSNNWATLVGALVAILGVIEGYRRLKRPGEKSDDTVPEPSKELKNVPWPVRAAKGPMRRRVAARWMTAPYRRRVERPRRGR